MVTVLRGSQQTLRPRPVPTSPDDARPAAESGCDEHPTFTSERYACTRDFRHFLRHWKFKDRESGEIRTFASLWVGQDHAVEKMMRYPWLCLLKAGKLGFTELECAFDGWVALYRQPNARVHIFSMNTKAATELLTVVKFGVTHLPAYLSLPIRASEPGGSTTTQFKLYGGPDDERTVVSYPAVKNAAIDQTATHSHVDELARMMWPDELWSSVESTVAPGGSVHIVSRGAGDSNAMADIWERAKTGEIPMHPHFEPWDSRPRVPQLEAGETLPEGVDPNEVWYQQRAGSMLPHQLRWLAPRTAEEALQGSSESQFVDEAQWLSCCPIDQEGNPTLPPLLPGDRIPIVLGVDAGVTNDLFAIVAVSRHPDRPLEQEVAVRAVRVWRPEDGREIDYDAVEDWIRAVCLGGCVAGHPNSRGGLSRVEGCDACRDNIRVPAHNVVQIAYDQYQLVDMMQSLSRDRVAWCNKFDQGTARLKADANLRQLIITRRITHRNDPTLNQHVRNANAETSPKEDTRLRIVKRNASAKIDALVATSMAAAECLRLIVENAR